MFPDATDRSGRTASIKGEDYELGELMSSWDRPDLTALLGLDQTATDTSSHVALIQGGRARRPQLFTGWRVGVTLSACTVVIVLVVNVALTAWVVTKYPTQEGGVYTILEDQCSRTKRWSMGVHLVINGLSTVLLSASNYCMQCLSSPTREEVDKAHVNRVWLDIGVPSMRNLRNINWQRVILWWLLGLSSVPLHLMYNSAIFESMSANEYSVIVVTEEFLSGGTWSRNEYDNPEGPPLQFLQDNASNTTMFQNLSTVDCITAYQNSLVVGRRNILAVTTNRDAGKAMNNTVVRVMSSSPTDVLWDIDPLAWICDDIPGYNSSYLFNTGLKLCDANLVIKSASTWKISNQKIDYCLSEKVSEECKLQFSLNLMIVVISCNVVKMLCLFFTVWKQKQTLVTIGDAIMSFLDNPDTTTARKCLTSKRDVVQRISKSGPWQPQRRHWYKAPSLKRWIICITLCIAALCITSILLDQGVQSLKQFGQPTSVGALWSMGFGAVNANAILFPGTRSRSTPATLLRSVLLGNLPQVILSFLYLMYNSLYTNMLLAHEWSQFAQVRKALRVTSPTGRQRSTYFLQLPYKYAIPLVISSGLMHWLVSQSIFLAHVTVLTNRGVEDPAADMTTCGYSCIAIIFVIIVGSLMVLAVIATGFRRLDPGIPLASSCSIAISAACHPPQDDVNAAILPVMWGAVEEKNEDVGHCTFTSMEVTPPVKGRLYAGLAGHTSGGKSTAVDLTECSNGGPSWV